MSTEIGNLKKDHMYDVVKVGSNESLNLANGQRMLAATGMYIGKNPEGEAIFATGKKNENGRPEVEYYDERYTFEEVPTAAGPGRSAVRTLNGRGRRRRAQPQTKKAAKKTCYPGYEVYNFRKNSRGVFYNCLPKKTRRRSTKKGKYRSV